MHLTFYQNKWKIGRSSYFSFLNESRLVRYILFTFILFNLTIFIDIIIFHLEHYFLK